MTVTLALCAAAALAQEPAGEMFDPDAPPLVAEPSALDERFQVTRLDGGPEEMAPPFAPMFVTGQLDNGLTVSVLAAPDMPVVATQVWVQVGSAHEAPSEAGFAHLFEHLMFGATTRYDKEAYSRHHTTHGGNENAYTAFDNTVYISEIGPQWHDPVLVFEADRMVNLVLDAENLANEQKIVTEELRLRTENNPLARLLSPALEALFGEHPYGHSPAGTKADIANADLELVKKFYDGYYHPANMHLVVVGPVDAPTVVRRAEALFGPTEKQRLVPPEVPALAGWDFPERVTLTEDVPPIKVAGAVYVGPTRQDPDYWAWKVMVEMLAGGELDRFREELVTERGKAVEAATIAEELRAGGILAFGSINLPFRSQRGAFKHLHAAVDGLDGADWLSQANLDTARRRLLRDTLEARYYAADMADAIGQAWSWQGDPSLALGGATEAIEAVTLAQVRTAWQTWVMDATPVELFVKRGKAQEVEP
ncbi:MAG: insulinase family protein [Alphaproteobacteria bacterium]|nr:insulinase family protein [Alphaproteobacteria bacterium]